MLAGRYRHRGVRLLERPPVGRRYFLMTSRWRPKKMATYRRKKICCNPQRRILSYFFRLFFLQLFDVSTFFQFVYFYSIVFFKNFANFRVFFHIFDFWSLYRPLAAAIVLVAKNGVERPIGCYIYPLFLKFAKKSLSIYFFCPSTFGGGHGTFFEYKLVFLVFLSVLYCFSGGVGASWREPLACGPSAKGSPPP